MPVTESALPTWDEPQVDTTTPAAEPVVEASAEVAPVPEAAATPPPPETVVPQTPESAAVETPPAPTPIPKGEKPQETPAEAKVDETDESPEDKEVLDALTIPQARKKAKQWKRDAVPIYKFLNYETPIGELGQSLYELSPSRYNAHVFDLLSQHSQQLFGMSLNEAVTKLKATPEAAVPASATPAPQPAAQPAIATDLSDAELDNLTNEELRARVSQVAEAAAAKAKQEVESQFQQQFADMKKQLDEVTGQVTETKTTEQQREIANKNQELFDKVWTVVDEGIRDLGLEAKADDPPRIAALKESARELLSYDHIAPVFDSSKENTDLVKKVYEANTRREYQNAFREEDNLKVRARAAFNTAASRQAVKAILDEIVAHANQSSAPSPAAAPAPPVPGSTAGVILKSPGTWDEAESMGAAATA